MIEFIEYQYLLITIVATLSFIITVSNLRFLDSLGGSTNFVNSQTRNVKVSVLIPARNEESNIGQCLGALINQDYGNLEILILDDHSADRTADLIQEFSGLDGRIKRLVGSELPLGWTGKNWACHQLAEKASGEVLLFVDADTILSGEAVSAAVTHFMNSDADLLAVMPRRSGDCVVEKLIFPFIDWAAFCWMPMKRAHKSQNPHLSATFGQFMLFKRDAYHAVGGHLAIRENPLDDIELGRGIKKRVLKWILLEGSNSVQVLPYRGNTDAFMSVSRSVFPFFSNRFNIVGLLQVFVILGLLSTLLLSLAFLPLFTVATKVMSYRQEMGVLAVSTLTIAMVAIPWMVVCLKFNRSPLTVLFYPLSISLIVVVGIHSMLTYGRGITSWKDRRILSPPQ